jgi:CHAP domain
MKRKAAFTVWRVGKSGVAKIVWSVPTSAPGGVWSLVATCVRGNSRSVARTKIRWRGKGSGFLVASPGGGKGGGSQSCQPIVEGGSGQVCFINDPFASYADPYVGADIGQCTWYAAGMRPDLDGIERYDASTWLTYAQRASIPTGKTPLVGSIAVSTTADHGVGHVAYVAGVENNGATLILDEANLQTPQHPEEGGVFLNIATPASDFQGYIYGGPAGNGPAGPGSGGSAPPPPTSFGGRGGVVSSPNGDQSVYFVGSDGGIHVWLYHGRWEEQNLGGSVAPDTSPSAFENSTGNTFVYYVGSDGAIHLWLWNGSKWEDQTLGGSVATGTSPSAFEDAAGNQSVYFVGSDGGIHVWLYHDRWEEQELGGSVAADTSPIAFENSAGTVLVYYVGSDGAIHLWLWNGSKWEDQNLGGSVAPTTSPIAFTESSTGSQFVYFIGSDHSIHLWLYGTHWEEQNLGGNAASGTSPDGF